MTETRALREIAARLASSRCTAAFTGAGMSTESGIPDFRGPGGVWSRRQPVMYQDFISSHAARAEYWSQKKESWPAFERARPNSGHAVLARLESEGRLAGIITQNIDGLHQQAGSRTVLELHGTQREVVCLDCPRRYPAGEIFRRMDEEAIEVPTCDECGGFLKPATVSFGQTLPEAVLQRSYELCLRCELLLAIGSSLVVYPAAGLPRAAKQAGAELVIINREETPLDEIADFVIRTPIGEALTAIAAAIPS